MKGRLSEIKNKILAPYKWMENYKMSGKRCIYLLIVMLIAVGVYRVPKHY